MLGTSIAGWSIAIVVVTIQVCMLYIFVRGAEFDVQDGELLMPFAEFHHEISSKRFPPQTMSILFIPTNAQGTPRNAATSLVSSIRRRSFCPLPFSQLVRRQDLDWKGWVVFCMLMFAHLMRDVINGWYVFVH